MGTLDNSTEDTARIMMIYRKIFGCVPPTIEEREAIFTSMWSYFSVSVAGREGYPYGIESFLNWVAQLKQAAWRHVLPPKLIYYYWRL